MKTTLPRIPLYAALVLLALAGCEPPQSSARRQAEHAGSSVPSKHAADMEAAKPVIEDLANLELVDPDGGTIRLGTLFGKQNLVVVISRGYFGSICPNCNTQMAGLAAVQAQIADLNSQVVVVFPVQTAEDRDRWQDLRQGVLGESPGLTSLPYAIYVDVELKAVDQLGLRDQLARPSTFVVDPAGKIRYAHIGNDPADRPTADDVLAQLRALVPPPAGS